MTGHVWNYRYRLTQAQADECRELYKSTIKLPTRHPDKWTYPKLQARYEVGRDTIYGILNAHTYNGENQHKSLVRKTVDKNAETSTSEL